VRPQHRLHRPTVEVAGERREARRDPGRLCPQLLFVDVLVAPPGVHVDGRDDPAPGDEPHDEQPPLEFGHQAGDRAGRHEVSTAASLPVAPYTPPR
jgi:hypothetical protein